jgi:tryptophanyl-tRNA synthetase
VAPHLHHPARLASADDALAPIRERHARLMQDPAELDRLLARGAERARAVAGPKLAEMKRRMGLLRPA